MIGFIGGHTIEAKTMAQGEDDSCVSSVIFVVLVVLCLVVALNDPVYHVGIDAVAGLNPATDLFQPTLHPEFDLRVRVDKGLLWGHGDGCLELGSTVAVSYRRVPLAAAAVPSRLCPEAGAGSVPVVARGSGVRVPGSVRDALARELWRGIGAPGFEITLTVPHQQQQGRWKVVSCRAKVGNAAALRADCAVSVVEEKWTFQKAAPDAPQIAAE
ncbi:unnamed protein product [Urochloa decumbens]|uniref:Late embryogenesis abundant protein LEA-2 subgroup domain-containing protein n=1 Tax=Urochloa decumbens TaxID=240449 RepID=A0ABC9EI94_9POAL